MMKILTAICSSILLCCALSAQECDDLMEVRYDDVTGITVTRMKENLYLFDNGIPVMALFVAQKEDDNGIESSLTFECRDLGCIINGASINFLFTDNTRSSEINISNTNCVGFAMLFIGIPDYTGDTIKDILLKKKIKTIRVNGTERYIQANLTEDDQVKLQLILKCLY